MNQTTSSRPNALFARLVMVLVLLTALITLAAALLFVVAILPISPSIRLRVWLAVFVVTGAGVVFMTLQRARGGDAAAEWQVARLFRPLGLSPAGDGATYAGVHRGRELRVAYGVSGAPQRPIHHLEIALHSRSPFKMAIGMDRVRHQFDETTFGDLFPSPDPAFAHLLIYSDSPEAMLAFLSHPRARAAILHLLAAEQPGVRNLTLTEGVLTLRFRHLSLKALSPQLVRAWADDLAAVVEAGESTTAH